MLEHVHVSLLSSFFYFFVMEKEKKNKTEVTKILVRMSLEHIIREVQEGCLEKLKLILIII